MDFSLADTIAALASPPGPGLRGIVRVSGPETLAVLAERFVAEDDARWRSARGARRHPGQWSLGPGLPLLPVALHLWPDSRSYTGQVLAEIHTLGSPPLLEAILSHLCAAGARPARPGEFTLRAFLAGRLDLMQAEAVLGVIDAADVDDLRVALRQLAGGLSDRIARVRSDLLDLLADVEAELDFTDEGLEFVSAAELTGRLTAARQAVEQILAQADRRGRSRERARVVLAGLPNAGKSTLFNALAAQPLALVSDVRGTTRDYLSAELEWEGTPIELIDTAGWESSAHPLMQAAFALRDGQLEQAQVAIWCIAADDAGPESATAFAAAREQSADRHAWLQVFTKADVSPVSVATGILQVSAVTGEGLPVLRTAVVRHLQADARSNSDVLGMTAVRCRDSLQGALAALDRALQVGHARDGGEFLAWEIHEALDSLGQITGAVYTNDILDRIFSRFCIGK